MKKIIKGGFEAFLTVGSIVIVAKLFGLDWDYVMDMTTMLILLTVIAIREEL